MTHKDFLIQVGLEIKVARIRRRMSIADLSKSTGLCINALNKIESGKNDSKILTYKRITDALGIELATILQ